MEDRYKIADLCQDQPVTTKLAIMFALEHEMLIALRRFNNKIRHVPPLVPFSSANPYDSWSTHTKECHNLPFHSRLGNILERFSHIELQEGQPLSVYIVQVRALARSLDPRTSQPFLIKWFLKGLRDEFISCYVIQQQPVTLDMAILFVIHHRIR